MKHQELKEKLNKLWNRLDDQRDYLERHVDSINDTIKKIAEIVNDIADLEDEDIEIEVVQNDAE